LTLRRFGHGISIFPNKQARSEGRCPNTSQARRSGHRCENSTPIFSPYADRAIKRPPMPNDIVGPGQLLFIAAAAEPVKGLNDFIAARGAANERAQLRWWRKARYASIEPQSVGHVARGL